MTLRRAHIALFLAALLVPFAASSQSVPSPVFQSNGIFGCNKDGALSQSAGATGATGGAFVPVADASVELNTGLLAYKECVLRGVVDAERQAVTSQYVQQVITTVDTGRNGNPLFVQSYGTESANAASQGATAYMNSGALSAINPAFQSQVIPAATRNYYVTVNQPNSVLSCPYAGIGVGLSGQEPASQVFATLAAEQNPACNPLFATILAEQQIGAAAAASQNAWLTQLSWGNGVYPITNANGIVTTPGIFVQASANQAIGSGYNQLQSANDIGQMVGALFAGISSQVLSQNGGLLGLIQANSGNASYLSQAVGQQQANLSGVVGNAALQILQSALQVEEQYYQAVSGIASNIEMTISQLQSEENQCWAIVVPQVQTYAQQQGITINVATSTAFSQAIIGPQIAPLASTTAVALNASASTTQVLENLIAGVSDTASPSAQQVALQQLDTLVSENALHTSQDVSNVQSQASQVQSQMSTLVTQTAQTWGDGQPDTSNPFDVNAGWCNVNVPATISMWANEWKTQ